MKKEWFLIEKTSYFYSVKLWNKTVIYETNL